MTVFNPQILDASMRDVVSSLNSEQKTDVLLYAMERVSESFTSAPTSRSRATIENATQSVLQVSATRPDKAIQARLLRAKARFAAGMRGAAHQDLQMILQLNPHHIEAASLIPAGVNHLSESGGRMRTQPRFSDEIWRQVASYLCKRDLRAILRVPHALSSIASQLLFQCLHLHFGTSKDEIDEWHSRRSAEIMSQLVSDAVYAGYVRSLVLFAPDADTDNTLSTFRITMITNVLPKLTNLRTMGCRMGGRATQAILSILEKSHPGLTGLILDPTTTHSPAFMLPPLPCLTRFAYGPTTPPPALTPLLINRSTALRSLVLHTRSLPPDPRISLNDLTSLDLHTTLQGEDGARALERILAEGIHLQELRLDCVIAHGCTLSVAFRNHPATLPALRRFEFVVADGEAEANNPDLFPAITEFVRLHPLLRSLRLSGARKLGFDAVVWSVLPTLQKLEGLAMDMPNDVKPALVGWLVPRSVLALCLRFEAIADEEGFFEQLCAGFPSSLTLLSLPALDREMSPALLKSIVQSLPNLSLLRLEEGTYSIKHTDRGIEMERKAVSRLPHTWEEVEVGGEGFASWMEDDRMPWHW